MPGAGAENCAGLSRQRAAPPKRRCRSQQRRPCPRRHSDPIFPLSVSISGGADGAAAQRPARGAAITRADGVYGALDLGTNNCRLLLARPSRRGFRVVDAFSRIIRLGEGVSQTGRLSEPAMARTLDALKVCAAKLGRAKVRRSRLVATEACRIAEQRRRVPRSRARQARPRHRDPDARGRGAARRLRLGGADRRQLRLRPRLRHRRRLLGADLARPHAPQPAARPPLRRTRSTPSTAWSAWTSLPIGVVTLAERFGGRHVTPADFEAMVERDAALLQPFEAQHGFRPPRRPRASHMLGTSGTVTTVAGIQLGLHALRPHPRRRLLAQRRRRARA